ncbi:TRAP transporter TatT component family protein [Fontivita pretiosa]|uniref:TRAP transporter TatT component family protein n=1 Tax=Fontivita pretiosa TaxID=2989684 RepID=UPI003D16FCE4
MNHRLVRGLRLFNRNVCLGIMSGWRVVPLLGLAGMLIAAGGCNLRQLAYRSMADALAESGSVFASDDDPELIRDAAPFSLKLMESVLAQTPQHRGLLTATCGGFTQYAYAFIVQDADELETRDIAAAQRLRDRARKLLYRARDYGLRGLDAAHPGFSDQLRANPKLAVQRTGRKDVPLLYWTAASWGAAIAISKQHPDLIADQPLVEVLIDRALQLDESYDHGAIHAFLISYEPARQGASENLEQRVRRHFQRAVELSEGLQAGPYVALAETICIQKQDRAEFESLLNKALAIDVNARPEWRLANVIMQRRARWLLSRIDELFA